MMNRAKEESLGKPAVLTINVDRVNGWYSATIDDMTFNLGHCTNDDLATGRVIRSAWMNAVFAKYGSVLVKCNF